MVKKHKEHLKKKALSKKLNSNNILESVKIFLSKSMDQFYKNELNFFNFDEARLSSNENRVVSKLQTHSNNIGIHTWIFGLIRQS